MNTSRTARLLTIAPALITLIGAGSATAGDFAAEMYTGDADSGINAALSYTAKVDFNGGTTINSVAFTDSGLTGTGYTLSGTGGVFSGYANGVGGNAGAAMSNFFYTSDGLGNASVTLTGLTPATQYVTSWYNTSFGGSRYVDITPSDTGVSFRFNEDANIIGAGNILRYAFTATGTSITYNFDALSNGDSFHHYALTNEVRNDALNAYTHFTPLPAVVTTGSTFAVSNTDLLQTNLASSLFTGNYNREPVLGSAAVLTNGAFDIGAGGNRPEMVTAENNATATYVLDLAVSPFGYDVTGITSYGGWGDGGRDQQEYSVWVSLVGSSDYVLYGQLDASGTGASPSGVMAAFTGTITGVDAVKFTFVDGQENGFVGVGELDVFGVASVPEPASAMFLLSGGCALLARRRRRVAAGQ